MGKHSFKKLAKALEEKGVDLEAYQEYLAKHFPYEEAETHESSLSQEDNSKHLEQIGRKLLSEGRLGLQEFNSLLENLSNPQNSREVLQALLKQRKIDVEEFLEFERKDWTKVQTQQGPYQLRWKEEASPEFYVSAEAEQEEYYGNYQIIEEIARGGVGIVYKAYHPKLNQTYALKVLIKGEGASETALKRFQREAQSTAKLKHPGVVQVVDSGSKGNEHYFVMEFVEGITLNDWIKEQHSLREGVELIQKCLEALHYAHEEGIVHRDLKPDNILITAEKEPKLTDFGLARDLGLSDTDSLKLTQTGAILGTPMYMSPEQARGEAKSLDRRTDIYSMGACLYEVLTSRRLFYAEVLHELLHQVSKEDPVPPSQHNKEIHRDLETVVLKSLEKDPEKRYPSSQEFAEDLRRFLEGYPIKARRATPLERLLKWSRRNKITASFFILLFIGCLGLLLFFFLQKKQALQKQYEYALEQSQKNKSSFKN